MKSGLSSGDISTALSFISNGAKEIYEYNFNLLNQHLGEMASGLHDFTLEDLYDREAECSVSGDQGGQTFSFHVLFVQDADGIWRIRFF
ncbi:MAG: hypothetical protein D3910_13490 [Candidatus Electrothrix sp. ATG2]|nr:hypothetical protein [Candidatus Electrothrix sp. ATG2]